MKVCLAHTRLKQIPICAHLAGLVRAIRFAHHLVALEQTHLALEESELQQRLRLAAQAATGGMALVVVAVVAEVQLAVLVVSHLSTLGLPQPPSKPEAVQLVAQVAAQEPAQPHFMLAHSLAMAAEAAVTRVLAATEFVAAEEADPALATSSVAEQVVLEWLW